MNKMEKFLDQFLSCLEEGKLMPLHIPKPDSLHLAGVIDHGCLDEDELHACTVTRRLNSTDTCKGYAQVFAIAGLVSELLAGGG